MNTEQFYKDCEFDIRIYKTKNMKNSKQIMTGNHKIGILTGIASLLQSCLDTKLMTPDELLETVNMVFEVRKTGARNKVIYNSFDRDIGILRLETAHQQGIAEAFKNNKSR